MGDTEYNALRAALERAVAASGDCGTKNPAECRVNNNRQCARCVAREALAGGGKSFPIYVPDAVRPDLPPIFGVEAVDHPVGYLKVSIILQVDPPATAYVRRDTALSLAAAIVRELQATPEERARVYSGEPT